MEHSLKHQRGYLLIAAIILIVIIAFLAIVLSNMVTHQAKSTLNASRSAQALYIGISGIDIAKRDLINQGISCQDLNGRHDAESLLNGEFTVTANPTYATSTLVGIYTNPDRIELTDASAFATEGLIKINDEYIAYTRKTGNILTGITRGKGESAVVSHTAGSIADQDQCLITSIGAIPSIASPNDAKRTVKTIMPNGNFSHGDFSFAGFFPIIGTTGKVGIKGSTTVHNPSVTLNGPGYEGSTIVATGDAKLTGIAQTLVGNNVVSSYKNHIEPDIVQNLDFSGDLFDVYFNGYSRDYIKGLAQANGHYYSTFNASVASTINGVTGKIIWIDDNVNIGGNTSITLGTPTEPVVLVVNGDFSLSGQGHFTIYGLLFAMDEFNLTGDATFYGEGAIGSIGDVQIAGNGDKTFTTSPDIMQAIFDVLPPARIINDLGIQEQFY